MTPKSIEYLLLCFTSKVFLARFNKAKEIISHQRLPQYQEENFVFAFFVIFCVKTYCIETIKISWRQTRKTTLITYEHVIFTILVLFRQCLCSTIGLMVVLFSIFLSHSIIFQ